MNVNTSDVKKIALVTGSAGFIGFHVCLRLLNAGFRVIGIDNHSDYYDVSLKLSRERKLKSKDDFIGIHESIENAGALRQILEDFKPEVIIHLAAQAGVRYSIEQPRSYLDTNICGTFELLEAARYYPPKHILIASTSSAYGARQEMPCRETDKSDFQMSFYAATKKATENMAHSYAHIYGLPVTMFRFFTVYGPWGRPDMALFKFTKSIMNDEPIDVFNYGEMRRDFTYIDDLVEAIFRLKEAVPSPENRLYLERTVDSLSPVAPFRIVNIGNSSSVKLMDYIAAIESALGKSAKKNFLPMQAGDVPETLADVTLLEELTGFTPSTDYRDGVVNFVNWYQSFYGS